MKATKLLLLHMMESIIVVHNKRTVLVTGGARGLGRAIVEKYAEEPNKYNIAINYLNSEENAIELLNSLQAKGVSSLVTKCDISKEDDVKMMVENVRNAFGSIDILINNSAICIDNIFYEKTVEDFKKTMDTNVIGTFLVSKYVGNIMLEHKFGRIINLSSTNGINTYYPMCIDYDASKSAIISLTHNLAVQFAPYVTVNAVAPGFIATESEVGGMDEEFIRMEEEKIMVRRVGQPSEVASLVKFLSSDEGAFINNQVIKINGGVYGDV